MESGPLVILPSATRHGIDRLDFLHAVSHAIRVFDLGDGLVMHVGPSRSGALLEVGVVALPDGTPAIAHAMKARKKFLQSTRKR